MFPRKFERWVFNRSTDSFFRGIVCDFRVRFDGAVIKTVSPIIYELLECGEICDVDFADSRRILDRPVQIDDARREGRRDRRPVE